MLATMDRRQRNGPISRVTKGVGSLIGLATEAHAYHQAKKSTEPNILTPSNDTTKDNVSTFSLEDCPLPPAYSYSFPNHDSTTAIQPQITPLPLPIIVPQRRPSTRSRGFLPVYSPDLFAHKRITQDDFISFLADLNSSSQSSSGLRAINIAAMAAGFVPSAIAIATSLSIQIAVRNAMKIQVKRRTESCLEKANREMFWPAGCHAFITTFAPGQKGSESIDVEIANDQSRRNMQGGKAISIPESAPLILLDSHDDLSLTKSSSTWCKSSSFTSNYFDKRAQAAHSEAYANITNPNGEAPKKPTFASRWADPNHATNSGSPLALITGGLVDPRAMLSQRRQDGGSGRSGLVARVRERRDGNQGGTDGQGRRAGGLGKAIRKVAAIEEGALYLVIAEVPKDMREEIERVLTITV
jgi:hypothetical protein